MTLGMRGHAGAAGARQDLAAEADPEIRHAAVEHALGVLGLVADAGEAVVVVGAHGSAEHHHRGVGTGIGRQRMVETGTAAVQSVAPSFQEFADPARRGMLLVDDDENHVSGSLSTPPSSN